MAYRFENNQLKIETSSGFSPLAPLVDKLATPFYVYSQANLLRRIEFLKSSFKKHKPKIFYAMKANNFTPVLDSMAKMGIGFDTVSIGEVRLAQRICNDSSRIIFSGVGKTKNEIREAIGSNITQLNVESIPELKRIGLLANELKQKVRVALRVNPNVVTTTHKYIQTGHEENKFGIEEVHLPEAVSIIQENEFIEFRGLAMHIGSQILNVQEFVPAIEKLLEHANKLKANGLEVVSLDLGGGIGINYETENEDQDFRRAQEWAQLIDQMVPLNFEIALEPGRWLVARMGCLVTEIQYLKMGTNKNFVIVDSGMNHLMRPALYQAVHRILPIKATGSHKITADVVGPICESSDTIGLDVNLLGVDEGDRLAILDSGAYGRTMASEYNMHDLPREFLI